MRIGIVANLDKKEQVLPFFREFSTFISGKNIHLILANLESFVGFSV